MKKRIRRVKRKALSLFLAAALTVTGINLPFSVMTVRAEGVENAEIAADWETVKDTESIANTETVEDTESIANTETVEDTESIENTETVEDTESMEDTETAKAAPNAEDEETPKDAKSLADAKTVEAVGNIDVLSLTDSGQFGESNALTWEFYEDTGVLSISGEGAMGESITECPWNSYKDKVTSVEIKEGVTNLAGSIFNGYTQILSVTVSASVAKIGDNAFNGCTSLGSVTLENETPAEIGENVFTDCAFVTNQNKSIKVPAGAYETYINDSKWTSWKDYIEISGGFGENNALKWSYDEKGKVLTISGEGAIPDYVELDQKNRPWKDYRSGIVNLVIEEGITQIGKNTFYYLNSLENVEIAESVTKIKESAFAANRLKMINMKGTVPAEIDKAAFLDISNSSKREKYIVVPTEAYHTYLDAWTEYQDNISGVFYQHDETEGTLTISGKGDMPYAWRGTWIRTIKGNIIGKQLKELIIEEGVTNIGSGLLYDNIYNSGCEELKKVTIPNSVTSIGEDAFHGCHSLPSIEIPDSVTSIGARAFYDCFDLTEVTISDNVTSIGDYAFKKCWNLTEITIPDNVTSIGDYLFNECKALKKVNLPENMTRIETGMFAACTGLKSVTIPESVTSIGNSAFIQSGLESVIIPKNVTSIEADAFSQTKLTSIVIPENVESLGKGVFMVCDNLTKVIMKPTIPPDAGDDIINLFYSTGFTLSDKVDKSRIIVPVGTVESYQKAWEYYKKFITDGISESLTGEGTRENPFLIQSQSDFMYFAYNHQEGKYYKMTSSIDLEGAEDNLWTPIGTENHPFQGILDGNGCAVSGLYVKVGEFSRGAGLFGFNNGTIKDLTVYGTVEGSFQVGGIAGVNMYDGTITGCTNYADVSGQESAGGIVGQNQGGMYTSLTVRDGTIENCVNRGTITGIQKPSYQTHSQGIGGIVGFNSSGKVLSCVNHAQIIREGDEILSYDKWNADKPEEHEVIGVGGIAGVHSGYRAETFTGNVNYGNIKGIKGVGGIVGKSLGPVWNSTNHGDVYASLGKVGGVSGYHDPSYGPNWWVLGNNANNGNVSVKGTYPIGGVIGEIRNNGNAVAVAGGYKNNYYLKTDKVNTNLSAIGNWPDEKLDAESASADRLPNPGEHFRGEGTRQAPYKIFNREDLEFLRDAVNGGTDYSGKYFILVGDIDLKGSETNPWTPIGTQEHPFQGNLNGDSHIIEGLYIKDEMADHQGLFGVNNGTIRNVKLEGNVTGHDCVGGIAGINNSNGLISGCSVGVNVTGNDYVGGIAGKNEGKIENCTSYGTVTGNDYIGGIAGSNGTKGTIKDSVNNGDVSVKEGGTGSHIGGITGENNNTSSGSVTGSYCQDDEVNKDITGIGGQDNTTSGITTGDKPIPEPGKDFAGQGTSKRPYKIYTEEELRKLQEAIEKNPEEYKGAHFDLMEDITLTEGENWKPIGTEEKPFEGTFHGNGHIINGLKIDDGTADNQGLFGVNSGTIENLTVEGSVKGKDNVGGIAGTNTKDGTIRDCISNVDVSGENNVGGIAGKNEGSIIRCATKTDGKTEGGSGIVETGSVTGTGENTGGIAGNNTGMIKDSTNNGDVTGGSNTGGVTGTNGDTGTVINGGNNGNVSAKDDGGKDTTGAIAGKNENQTDGSVSGSYKKDEDTNKDINGIGGTSSDPDGITAVTGGGNVPNPEKPFEGSGTKEDPYQIKTEDDLKKLAEIVNSGEKQDGIHYKIESEDGITLTDKSSPWTPIGTEEHPFTGSFDGDGKTIDGLKIDDKTKDNQGLFGVNAGTIENLTVEGSVTGKDNVGGIAGTNTEEGTIKNSTSNVTVSGENNVGGITGKNDGTITNCTDNGSVTGTGSSTGGITGTNNGSIEGSTNSAEVTGTDNTGGIAGTNNGSIEGSTNSADVTGKDNVGGIAGTNGNGGSVKDTTNNGNVTGEGEDNTGAVIGKNDNQNQEDIDGNYYQKTDEINKDLTGIGGVNPDPSGIASGESPTYEKLFEGSGTQEDPYIIATKEDLEKLRDSVNGGNSYKGKEFKLTANIYLDGTSGPWTPIGTVEHPFAGKLYGDYYYISGLYIDRASSDNQGLFGVNAGTIELLNVEGSVTGKDNVGGIAGINAGSGIISNCTTNVTVTGNNDIGGIAGRNEGTITGCRVIGDVIGTGSGAGGITGTNEGNVGTNTNKGTVTGVNDVGGIAGTNGENGTVGGNTNSGNVTGEGGNTPGAVIGNNKNQNLDDIRDDYYQKTENINKDLTGIGVGTGAGTDPSGITSGKTPTNQGTPTDPTDPTDPEKPFKGSGTAENPYQITSKEDLEKLRNLVDTGKVSEDDHFKLTTDINLGGSGENPWTPIGTEENPFKGTLDGDGHKVSGLHIDDKTKDNQGLFGVNEGTIENLTVSGNVTGKDNVGGIAGTNTEKGTIKDCTSSVTVNGDNNVGGIAGKNDGTITGCTNSGNVTGTGNNVGGITGSNTGTVNGSDNSGEVSGNNNVGGITGNNTGTVSGSDNSGEVSGNDNVGGITGSNAGNGKVENSTNSGAVTGNGTGAGGIAGKNDGTLDNDTNTAPVTGKEGIGGITGTNGENGTVKDCTNSGNVTVTEDGTGTPGAIIGNNQNQDPDAVTGDYYQKTEGINKDITGIGEGAGAGTDPAGITSGQTPTDPRKDLAAAKAFEDEKIAAIEQASPVGGTAWKQAVKDAEEAFDRLTDRQKELVSDRAKKTLTDAEAILAAIEKIEAIGTVTNTSTCGQKIQAARDAYNKLTSDQKAKIPESTKKILTDAESAYAALQKGDQGGSQNGGQNLTKEEKEQIQTIVKELGVSEETAAKIQAAAKELGIPVETLLIREDTITDLKTESDVKGSTFSKLQAKVTKVTKKSIKLTWNKVKGADGYQIYGAPCGKGSKTKLLKTIKNGSTKTYTQKKLKKGKAYRYVVRAYKLIDGKKITIATSKTVHAYTSGGKYGNEKSVSVSSARVYLVKGKTANVKAEIVKAKKSPKRHRKLWVYYESSNTKVATVTKSGTIKGKAKGTCTIYAYAQNGVSKKIKVTVTAKAKKSTSISLNKKSYSMKKGASYNLKPKVKPAASTDTVKWSSSNKKIAAVDAFGTVKAKKKGTATITAITTSGKKATCKITVK